MNTQHPQQPPQPPPLSPVLFAGMALRALPVFPLQPLLTLAMLAVRRRHPDLFSRLSGLEDATILIDPVDLPFVFHLRPHPESPELSIARSADDGDATATIRGGLMALIDLLEGRLDGDALFFSRDLTILGDTEAVVALRNAIDAAEIDLTRDILSQLGLFSGPARIMANLVGALYRRAADDLERVQGAMTARVQQKLEGQARALGQLEKRVTGGNRRMRRGGK